jgi:hypothetical protein
MELMGAGEVGASLLVLVLGIVIAFLIDDDDLPGPRLCRVASQT